MMRSAFRKLAATAIAVVATQLGACGADPATFEYLALSANAASGTASKQDLDQALAKIEPTARKILIDDGGLWRLYGADAVYISPAQREALLKDSTLFRFTVTTAELNRSQTSGTFDVYATLYADAFNKKGDADFLRRLQDLADQFPRVAQAYRDMNGRFVDERLAALKARTSPEFVDKLFSNHESANRLTDLLWNNENFNRLMTDDDYAKAWLALSGQNTKRADGTWILNDLRNNLGPALGSGTGRTGS